jgi:ankyrin repeat protein
MVIWLATHKADVNAKGVGGLTPLHEATGAYQAAEVIQALLERGAKINARTDRGVTALHYAAARIVPKEVVELLVLKGAEINAKDNNGKTPLDWAQDRGFDRRRIDPMEQKHRQAIIDLLICKGGKSGEELR